MFKKHTVFKTKYFVKHTTDVVKRFLKCFNFYALVLVTGDEFRILGLFVEEIQEDSDVFSNYCPRGLYKLTKSRMDYLIKEQLKSGRLAVWCQINSVIYRRPTLLNLRE